MSYQLVNYHLVFCLYASDHFFLWKVLELVHRLETLVYNFNGEVQIHLELKAQYQYVHFCPFSLSDFEEFNQPYGHKQMNHVYLLFVFDLLHIYHYDHFPTVDSMCT